MQDALGGVKMELNDCAFPLLAGTICASTMTEGFKDISYAMLVGSKPRGPGMERADLLKDNGKIFIDQGKALDDNALRTCKTIVVGNPANTNCMIAAHYAKNIPKGNFTAMTRLDHNRAIHQLAAVAGAHINDVEKAFVWGNHSPTMVPDISVATIAGKPATSIVDNSWVSNEFIPVVQQRGAAIIKARKLSSAASAANAAMNHIHDWVLGTNGKWTSMSVPSDGSYNVPEGIVFSYPVTCENGEYKIVQGLEITPENQKRFKVTLDELLAERDAVQDMLK